VLEGESFGFLGVAAMPEAIWIVVLPFRRSVASTDDAIGIAGEALGATATFAGTTDVGLLSETTSAR